MDTKASSFVTIMIIIAVCSLLLRIIIEQIIKLNIEQNESNAQATIKLLSTALENYAKDNRGVFPANVLILTKTNPPYLDKDYIDVSPVKGYNYSCPRIEPSGYNCYAHPIRCGLTGNIVYSITSGGLLITEGCSKKE